MALGLRSIGEAVDAPTVAVDLGMGVGKTAYAKADEALWPVTPLGEAPGAVVRVWIDRAVRHRHRSVDHVGATVKHPAWPRSVEIVPRRRASRVRGVRRGDDARTSEGDQPWSHSAARTRSTMDGISAAGHAQPADGFSSFIRRSAARAMRGSTPS